MTEAELKVKYKCQTKWLLVRLSLDIRYNKLSAPKAYVSFCFLFCICHYFLFVFILSLKCRLFYQDVGPSHLFFVSCTFKPPNVPHSVCLSFQEKQFWNLVFSFIMMVFITFFSVTTNHSHLHLVWSIRYGAYIMESNLRSVDTYFLFNGILPFLSLTHIVLSYGTLFIKKSLGF